MTETRRFGAAAAWKALLMLVLLVGALWGVIALRGSMSEEGAEEDVASEEEPFVSSRTSLPALEPELQPEPTPSPPAPEPEAATTPPASPPRAKRGPERIMITPPGLVRIPGGRARIGTDHEELVRFLEENPDLVDKAAGFLSEVPEHGVMLDDYHLMLTEVTGEQYAEYVEKSGARPPHTWGDAAYGEASKAHIRAAIEAGRESRQLVHPKRLDREEWWNENWRHSEWELPSELATRPVTNITYEEAQGYARWAGLRLPTEFEFERAARGHEGRPFPWGETWIPEAAATDYQVRDVGSFPKGASDDGVLDLIGNVWEWTTSSYLTYPGWKHSRFTLGSGAERREVNAIPRFSPDRRVMRGGGVGGQRAWARATTRAGVSRDLRSGVLGFRCAASSGTRQDLVQRLAREIPVELLPSRDGQPLGFSPSESAGIDRWRVVDGSSPVPGYAVITGYEYALFTPVEELDAYSLQDLQPSGSGDGTNLLGFLSTSLSLLEPALPPGTYLVALRESESAAGGMRYLLQDMDRGVVAELPAQGLVFANYSSRTPIGAELLQGFVEATPLADSMGARLDLSFFIQGGARKGLAGTLGLRLEPELVQGPWRRE